MPLRFICARRAPYTMDLSELENCWLAYTFFSPAAVAAGWFGSRVPAIFMRVSRFNLNLASSICFPYAG